VEKRVVHMVVGGDGKGGSRGKEGRAGGWMIGWMGAG